MITEKEFELQKQIWELQNQKTGLTVGLIVISALFLLILLYCMINNLTDNDK